MALYLLISDPMTDKEIDYSDEEKKETSDKELLSSEDQAAKEIRWKDQAAWNKAEAEKQRNLRIDAEVKLASQDAESLRNLHKVDNKLAKEVSEKLDWTNSKRKDYETFLKGEEWLPQKSEVDVKAQFEAMYQERKTQELHELALQKASKLIWKIKDEDAQKQAQTYFDKIIKGKMLSIDDAEEFAEMATLYVNKDSLKSEKYDNWLAQFASTGVATSKKATAKEPIQVVRNGKLVLLDSNDNK